VGDCLVEFRHFSLTKMGFEIVERLVTHAPRVAAIVSALLLPFFRSEKGVEHRVLHCVFVDAPATPFAVLCD
jgi:hypothetical protein